MERRYSTELDLTPVVEDPTKSAAMTILQNLTHITFSLGFGQLDPRLRTKRAPDANRNL
jgi:hypothetical protein